MKIRYLLIIPILLTVFFSQLVATNRASALSGSSFSAGRIIDDWIFTNKNSMNVTQIQNFLNAKVPTCARWHSAYNAQNPPPYTCLKEYQENTTTGENNFGRFNGDGSPYNVPGGKSAAQIIWEASQAYNINPQTMIVLLQKEQALVTDDWPLLSQFTKATGYLCPDTAACNSNAGGFSKQVFGAAWQFRHDLDGIDTANYWAPYGKGLNNIRYSPNAACGTKSVYIVNQATAVLYKYTPYTPNQSALDNLYGSGDGCGAYGNRNFWRYFNDWFGPTIADAATADRYAHPDGTLIRYLTDPTIYIVINGERRHISSIEVFESYRFQFPAVKLFTTGDLSVPVGLPFSQFRPGSILRLVGDANYYQVYNLNDGTQRVKTLTADVCQKLGYKLSSVITVAANQLPANDGVPASENNAHPNGTLIIDPRDLYVYIIEGGKKRHIPSPNTLFSYRYNFNDPIKANLADQQLPIGAPMPYDEGQLLLDSLGRVVVANTVDETGQAGLRHIPAYFIFIGLRYTWQDVRQLDVNNVPDGPILQPKF